MYVIKIKNNSYSLKLLFAYFVENLIITYSEFFKIQHEAQKY